MKVKQFDCVAIKRLGSEKIYEDIKNMKIKEELAYWQQATKELENLQSQSQFSEESATTNLVCCQGSSPNKFNLFSLEGHLALIKLTVNVQFGLHIPCQKNLWQLQLIITSYHQYLNLD